MFSPSSHTRRIADHRIIPTTETSGLSGAVPPLVSTSQSPLFCDEDPLWIACLVTTPVQQRLAFNGPVSMRIEWSTFQQREQPTVYFGQFPARYFSLCQLAEQHNPYTTCRYKIVSTNSTIGSFKTARAAGDRTLFAMAGGASH
ncbi:Acid phosphatase [Mycena venus]|uniref:Acid phosphatase n=1 Tax=Mycena venus TaxID=2733690 RepID=A0A8H7D8Z0_9AGAR|nr:Acid phosphatase [Mycena venus]